jgi:phospholipid/cholesterol/gamma-HCH transport system substrate-binding protein
MARRGTEILIGAAALVFGTAAIAVLYAGGGTKAAEGYPLSARFHRADGIALGSDVRLSGVPVGQVVGQKLDDTYRAVITMRLAPGLQLSADTAAVIQTDGLLGAKYISLEPGGDENMLPPGGEIIYTQDAVVIEDLLETIISEAKMRRGIVEQGAVR